MDPSSLESRIFLPISSHDKNDSYWWLSVPSRRCRAHFLRLWQVAHPLGCSCVWNCDFLIWTISAIPFFRGRMPGRGVLRGHPQGKKGPSLSDLNDDYKTLCHLNTDKLVKWLQAIVLENSGWFQWVLDPQYLLFQVSTGIFPSRKKNFMTV